jgi:hypothetical protein
MFSPHDIAAQNFESQNPIPDVSLDWSAQESISPRASIVGERLALKSLESFKPLATNPLSLEATHSAQAGGSSVSLSY